MPFWIFRTLFPKSTKEALHVTENNIVVLKTYNYSNIEQLGVCTVRLRHKDKIAICRIFAVPGDHPALLAMTDTELLNILKITLWPPKSQPSSGSCCKANKGQQIKTDNVEVNYANSNMPDYFRSSINRTADWRASQVLRQKNTQWIQWLFFRNWVLWRNI